MTRIRQRQRTRAAPAIFKVRLAGQTNWIPLLDHEQPVRDLDLAVQIADSDYPLEWCEVSNDHVGAYRNNKGRLIKVVCDD